MQAPPGRKPVRYLCNHRFVAQREGYVDITGDDAVAQSVFRTGRGGGREQGEKL